MVGDECAAFTASAQVFAGVKAEAGHRAESAHDFSAILCPMRLGRILNQRYIALAANLQQRLKVGRMAVEMDWKNRLGARRNGPLHEVRIEIEGGILDIHVNRLRANVG